MIRDAEFSDVSNITDMLAEFHAEADQPYEFRRADTVQFVRNMIASPAGIVLTSGGGFVCGLLTPCPANNRWNMGMELYWWAKDGKGGSLMKAFKKKALEMGANEIRVSHRASTPKVGTFLERDGFSLDENVYARVF